MSEGLIDHFHTWAEKLRRLLHDTEIDHDPRTNRGTKVIADNTFSDPDMLFKKMPYQLFHDDCFVNKKSVGLGWILQPLCGADEAMMLTLANLIKNKIPPTVEVQCLLLGHPWVGGQLNRGIPGLSSEHPLFRALAQSALNYHEKAIFDGYPNPRKTPATLRDYQVFFFLSQKKGRLEHTLSHLKNVREDIEAEWQAAHMGFQRMPLPTFLRLVQRLTTPHRYTTDWPEGEVEPELTLNHQCLEKGSAVTIEKDYLDVSYPLSPLNSETKTTRIVSLTLAKPPKTFALWMTPDNFSNVFDSQKGITCPFVLNVIFKVKPLSQSKGAANSGSLIASHMASSAKYKHFTGAFETDQEKQQHKDLLNDEKTVDCELFYSLTLFSTPETAKRDTARALSAFRANGMNLYVPPMLQMPHYLANLPFLSSEGLFTELNHFGLTRKKLKHFNVANLLPLVADFKGCPKGMLLPTFRHQVHFFNNFDDKALPITNYNQFVVASPGSGKSVFCNDMILTQLSQGVQVFVIDLGGSYKHLCELVGGDYIDASTLTLNPFTLFDVEDVEIEKGGKMEIISMNEAVKNLLGVMSNPEGALLPVQSNWLLKAVSAVRALKGRKACVDDIVAYLETIRLERPQDERLYDLILSFDSYTTQGDFGHIFNGEASAFSKKPLVVLEMQAFEKIKDLSKIVMFVMISLIQTEFYHSPRNQCKSCFIDEAWRWLCEGNNTMAADFIGAGYRTARKHRGSFTTIVQNIEAIEQSSQGLAIKSCSDINIVLRQGKFDEYVEKHPKAFNALEQTLIRNFGEAKNNGYSEMMIKTEKYSSFHRLFLHPFAKVLYSSDGEEYQAVEHYRLQGYPIIEAVKKVVEERYGV